jgi:hypothetical protein
MTATQGNLVAFLGAVLTIVAVSGMYLVAVEATSVVSATRVAHDVTRAELADTYSELAMTLVELYECEKQTN